MQAHTCWRSALNHVSAQFRITVSFWQWQCRGRDTVRWYTIKKKKNITTHEIIRVEVEEPIQIAVRRIFHSLTFLFKMKWLPLCEVCDSRCAILIISFTIDSTHTGQPSLCTQKKKTENDVRSRHKRNLSRRSKCVSARYSFILSLQRTWGCTHIQRIFIISIAHLHTNDSYIFNCCCRRRHSNSY